MALAMIEGAERSGRLRPARRWSSTRAGARAPRWPSSARSRATPSNRHLGCVRAGEAADDAGLRSRARRGPQPGGDHRRPDSAAHRAGGRGRRGGRRLRHRPVPERGHDRRVRGARRRAGRPARRPGRCVLLLRGDRGLLPRRHPGPPARASDLHRAVVEPAESPVISEGRAGTHHIEGGGVGFWPPLLSRGDFDEVFAVPEAEAFAMADGRRASRGSSAGPPPARTSSSRSSWPSVSAPSRVSPRSTSTRA